MKFLDLSGASDPLKLLSEKYPGYAFEKHVGYGTKAHIDALRLLGVCDLHRLSYKPIKAFV